MKSFHELTKDDSCSELLSKFFDVCNGKSGNALDLGCGSGRDSLELLKSGWSVTSVDKSREGLTFLEEKLSNREGIEIINEEFEGLKLKENFYDLIYSSFALSFCQKSHWPELWKEMVKSLKNKGFIAINCFGINDGFKNSRLYGEMTFFTKEFLYDHFRDFNIIFEEEREVDKRSKVGQMKHWHIFTIIAQKN